MEPVDETDTASSSTDAGNKRKANYGEDEMPKTKIRTTDIDNQERAKLFKNFFYI